MPGLTDNELRALSYFAIGVSSEGGDVAYKLSFAGNVRNDAHGNPVMHPAGNSGYSIGTLQTDLGQRPAVATQLTDAYQNWARTTHPDWVLTDAQRTQTISDLRRTGHQITAQHGRPLDATVKSHLDSFMASEAGVNFVHQRDVAQVDKLMTNVIEPLQKTDLYKHASEQDQARLATITAKLYNQSEKYGGDVLGKIQRGELHSVTDVSNALNHYPDYVTAGRDHALAGAALYNDLRAAGANNPMHGAWQNVVANPTVNPNRLGADPTHPQLPHEYSVVKDAFVDPHHSRQMVQALDQGGSYANTENKRGYIAEGRDMVVWDRAGHGHALVNGHWSDVNSRDISLHKNADKTLDVNVHRNGGDEKLLHVTHPGNARTPSAHPGHSAPSSASGDHIQRAGTLRENDHAPQVKDLQQQLAALGYKGADGKLVHPDGDFGKNTRVALEAFQKEHGLTSDGIAGAKTMDALRTANKQVSPGLADNAHPGHAMYEQALKGVSDLDAKLGRKPDQATSNLAGAVATAAHKQGLTRVDHVVFDEKHQHAYAVQGDLNSPLKKVAEVDVAQAVGKPLEQSGKEWQGQPNPAQEQPAQQQQQQQQAAHPAQR